VIALDIGIAFLMIFNRRNWQSYIMWQLLMLLVSAGIVLLYIFEIITNPYVSGLAVLMTIFMFLGTVIFGDRRARVELYRRFHI
jgi:uncharacterized membrane protein SirB2